MENKTGIVMKIEKNIAYIMTTSGEFTKVKITKNRPIPVIGSEYCGITIKNNFIKTNILKHTAAACLAFIIFLSSGGAYSYYRPVSTITVSINPVIELKSNIWNKVISVNPLNSDGKKITDEISLKNKSVDNALVSILNQAKNDKFIDNNYKELNKIITVNISGKEPNLSFFENEINKNKLNVKIDRNGSTILNSFLNKNNEKLPNSSNNNEPSELNNQPNTKNTIDNSNTSTNKPSQFNNNFEENINIKDNSKGKVNDVILNDSRKSEDTTHDKNSSKNGNSIKDTTNSENEKDKLTDSNNKYHNSNKNDKEEGTDKQ